MQSAAEILAQRIQALTPDQVSKVEELIRVFQSDENRRAALVASEPAFAAAWNNPEDDVYDSI